MPFTIDPLPYAENALEPYIDEETMKTHYGKHYSGYTKKLNETVQGTDLNDMSIEEILSDLYAIPENIRTAIRNNGGGYINHKMFWTFLTPKETKPSFSLSMKIEATFNNMEEFQNKFKETAKNIFGSGWAWLVSDQGKLRIISTPNQDTPIMENKKPLLGLDVWEHAYYLKYKNNREEYIDGFFNIINWDTVSELYEKSK